MLMMFNDHPRHTGTVAMTTMLMMPKGHSIQSDGDNSGNGFLYSQIIAYPDYLSLAQLYLIYHTHQCALQHIGGYDMYSLVSFSMYPEESCATMGALNCPVMEHEKILSQFGEI